MIIPPQNDPVKTYNCVLFWFGCISIWQTRQQRTMQIGRQTKWVPKFTLENYFEKWASK